MRLSRYARAFPGHATEGDAWPSWVSAGARRRFDPLTRLACAAVDRLLQQGAALHPDTAVLVATSYGAVDSTFKFAHSISAYGDAGGSPTPFTTSVHNSCAAAIGELLHLHGPTTTISHGATGPLAALRFAHRLVETGRAPAALVLAGERHNEWSRRVVAQLSGSRWPIGDGMVGCLVEPGSGSGRALSLQIPASTNVQQVSGGVLNDHDEMLLKNGRNNTDHNLVNVPDVIAQWWPGCGLAGITWNDTSDVVLVECEGNRRERVWLGRFRDQ
jgi:3-oxoacyl-[acyl-carrier-protein] synthase III